MKVKSVKFSGSFSKINQLPKLRLPEIAFAGRSNVGKSSLINSLINRKNLALTSSTPGKTRVLNYYFINDQFFFVDLPGYGYAKVSQKERFSWKRLVESYLSENKYLKGVIQIIDSRHGLTNLDREMIKWLSHLQLPTLLVATKTDKLPKSKKNHIIQNIFIDANEFGVNNIIPFSTITKHGKNEIWQSITELLKREDTK